MSDKISSALTFIPSDDRDIWIRIGMALKSELGDSGLGLWLAWSQGSPKYNERDALAVWRSIRPDGAVRIATLYHLAQHHGWRSGKETRPPLKPVAEIPKVKPKTNTESYALSLWERAQRDNRAVADHPYSQAKGIDWAAGAARGRASGCVIGTDVDCLLIPCRNVFSDQLVSVQAINADGVKQTFGPMGDGALVLGNTLHKEIRWFVVEGWADAVSLCFHHKGGNAVVAAAFGQGRLERVARCLRAHYWVPKVVIVDDKEVKA